MEDAFLLQLDQDPEDDTTLLVYADWLDEQGDADRAAFLRLQAQVRTLRYRQKGFMPMADSMPPAMSRWNSSAPGKVASLSKSRPSCPSVVSHARPPS